MPMSPAVEQILQAALALPEGERRKLVEALLVSGDQPGELPFDPARMEEIRQRSAEIDSGEVQTTPWPIVRERVRQRLAMRARD